MTLQCLASLIEIAYPNYHIVVVDNGSEDESVSAIRATYPNLNIIQNKTNLGVAGGRNVGIGYALEQGSDYLLLLDNDTVVDQDFLIEMVKVAERDRQTGILTPKIYFFSHPNKIYSAGGTLSLYRCDFRLNGYDEIDRGQYDWIKEVEHVSGCCLMIKRQVIDEIGLLDENFNPYFGEDTDWCMRAKKRGYRILYVPTARIWHHVVRKTSLSDQYLYLKGRNLILFMRKHAQIHHWTVFSIILAVQSLKVFYREARDGNTRRFFTMAKGALNAFTTKKPLFFQKKRGF